MLRSEGAHFRRIKGEIMSYIITAEVRKDSEENIFGKPEKVNARILSETQHTIEFDVKGDFYKQKEITKNLCMSLIDAGYLSFEIGHSW